MRKLTIISLLAMSMNVFSQMDEDATFHCHALPTEENIESGESANPRIIFRFYKTTNESTNEVSYSVFATMSDMIVAYGPVEYIYDNGDKEIWTIVNNQPVSRVYKKHNPKHIFHGKKVDQPFDLIIYDQVAQVIKDEYIYYSKLTFKSAPNKPRYMLCRWNENPSKNY